MNKEYREKKLKEISDVLKRDFSVSVVAVNLNDEDDDTVNMSLFSSCSGEFLLNVILSLFSQRNGLVSAVIARFISSEEFRNDEVLKYNLKLLSHLPELYIASVLKDLISQFPESYKMAKLMINEAKKKND